MDLKATALKAKANRATAMCRGKISHPPGTILETLDTVLTPVSTERGQLRLHWNSHLCGTAKKLSKILIPGTVRCQVYAIWQPRPELNHLQAVDLSQLILVTSKFGVLKTVDQFWHPKEFDFPKLGRKISRPSSSSRPRLQTWLKNLLGALS